jgi:hypothetical protein
LAHRYFGESLGYIPSAGDGIYESERFILFATDNKLSFGSTIHRCDPSTNCVSFYVLYLFDICDVIWCWDNETPLEVTFEFGCNRWRERLRHPTAQSNETIIKAYRGSHDGGIYETWLTFYQ